MKWLFFPIAALQGYLVCAINPAIFLSRRVYGKDIRECGSGNPGFTNFKRCFGGRIAWLVFLFDMLKAAVVVVPMGLVYGAYFGDFAVGAAFTGLFCVWGHAYPVAYGFKGRKGFLVSLATLWAVDARVGAISTLFMVVLLLITHYMSLSTVVSLLVAPVFLLLFKIHVVAVLLVSTIVLFTAFRHRENFKRLFSGCESKFYLGAKKK